MFQLMLLLDADEEKWGQRAIVSNIGNNCSLNPFSLTTLILGNCSMRCSTFCIHAVVALLIEQLAIRPGCTTTTAKSLVIPEGEGMVNHPHPNPLPEGEGMVWGGSLRERGFRW
jgi:hypothetical protein